MTKPNEPIKGITSKQNIVDRYGLYHTVDSYNWIYERDDVSRDNVCRPGHFNEFRSEMRLRAVLECRLGKLADGIEQFWVEIIDAPRGDQGGDILVSAGLSTRFTPIRHDGTLETEETAV